MTGQPTSPRGFCSGLWTIGFPSRPTVKTLISEGEMRQGEFSTKMGPSHHRHGVVQASPGETPFAPVPFLEKGQEEPIGDKGQLRQGNGIIRSGLKCRIWIITLWGWPFRQTPLIAGYPGRHPIMSPTLSSSWLSRNWKCVNQRWSNKSLNQSRERLLRGYPWKSARRRDP